MDEHPTKSDVEHLRELFQSELKGIKELLQTEMRLFREQMKSEADLHYRALREAKEALDGELVKLNNLRKEVTEDRASLPTKVEMFAEISNVRSEITAIHVGQEQQSKQITDIEKFIANLTGKMWAVGVGFTILNVVIIASSFFLPKH